MEFAAMIHDLLMGYVFSLHVLMGLFCSCLAFRILWHIIRKGRGRFADYAGFGFFLLIFFFGIFLAALVPLIAYTPILLPIVSRYPDADGPSLFITAMILAYLASIILPLLVLPAYLFRIRYAADATKKRWVKTALGTGIVFILSVFPLLVFFF